MFVNANTPAYAVVFGKTDFSDAHNSIKIDHLVVNNASAAPGSGGCQFNYVLDSDIYAICVSAGGGAGLALEQTQFSRISGAGTAEGTGGRGLLLENGYNFSNTFLALDLEVSPTCLSITFDHNGLNTFISPYFNCVTAINATASSGNILINPNYGGADGQFRAVLDRCYGDWRRVAQPVVFPVDSELYGGPRRRWAQYFELQCPRRVDDRDPSGDEQRQSRLDDGLWNR